MSAASRPKASDKQAILKKLFPLLKKQYKASPPKYDFPILETLIHAVCLENASQEQAEAAQERLDEAFHDYNEIRVSSISELNKVFEGMDSPELRSMRIRSVLHYVFEEHYEFEFEGLRRKTLELATKQLNKIRDISPFMRNFTLQVALGSHLVPVDDVMLQPVKWLGLVEPDASPEDASEQLKSAVRKTEGPLFCHLIRNLAHDSKLASAFDQEEAAEDYDLNTAPARLKKLLEEGPDKKSKKTAKGTSKKTTKAAQSGKSSQKNGSSAKSKKSSKKSNTASTR